MSHDELLPSALLHFCVVLWDLVMYFGWKVSDVLTLVYKGAWDHKALAW